jgi:hypothetical protein
MSEYFDHIGFYDDYVYKPTLSDDYIAQAMGYDIGAPSSYFLPPAGQDAGSNIVDTILSSAKGIGKGLTTPRGLAGLLGMLLGASQGKQAPRGGISLNLSPSKVTRKMTQGRYGPTAIHEFAANGGLMQAYASGGTVTGTNQNPLPMEDGGFVLTAEAVRNGGGPQGIAQLLPGAKLIRGPGTGTSDHIPATIAGRTPARVSNGEMYVPKAQVDEAGGARALYALMHQLQRSA